jgi:hypothetical protein
MTLRPAAKLAHHRWAADVVHARHAAPELPEGELVYPLKPTRRGRFLQKGGFSPATTLPPLY